jgi:ubiquinone/menaquinone biosynthesis C-methylase UbiE
MPRHPIFAGLYDRMLAGVERAGLGAMRSGVLADARGETLEIGAGTGHNLAHYPHTLDRLVLTEPDPYMARRLRRRLHELELTAEVVEAGAESLPFADSSFDTVVSTLVLCTVPDPARAIEEVARVLRPGGSLLCLEHVVSPSSPRLARWQRRLERPWGWFAGGCHPNRNTAEALLAGGFDLAQVEPDRMPNAAGPIVRPLIRGSATLRDG